MFSLLRVCVSVCRYLLNKTGTVMNGFPQKLLQMMIIENILCSLKFDSESNWFCEYLYLSPDHNTLYSLVWQSVSEAS